MAILLPSCPGFFTTYCHVDVPKLEDYDEIRTHQRRSHTQACLGTGPSNYGSGPWVIISQAQSASFEHVVSSVSTSGWVGLPGYGFQVAHGGQVGNEVCLVM